ncbi:hypothetical protein DOTSEDRAFT_67604 [Dothistroma septosporum NZE10]|uniref:Bromo domain-containing protein n=1 Tax=Dothistroma septosporum (strain NZE10 / CBS 128990) TaxID=675120 RepID=N1Q2E9_DOTSN|nr:hypothetical protein DOTSEDRAFT_67604 [Dothistroma septosporum NZE10]
MSTLPTAYTALESLLLFQALRNDGVRYGCFSRISDLLQKIPLIRDDPSYDAGRLSPDALRELYLRLLKDELKADLARQTNGDTHLTNGDVSPGSRKRKAPSPSLPTVQEASQHEHLLPQLVTRLYTTFRDTTVSRLKSYESKYAVVKHEVEEIEAGRWDDILQRQRAASHTHTPRASPKPSSTAHTQSNVTRQEQIRATNSASASPVLAQKPPVDNVQAPPKRYSQAKIDAVINHGPEPQDSPDHQRASSNTTLPPLSEMAPQSPRFGLPPKMPNSVPQQMQPMQHGSSQGYTRSPPAGHQSPYAPPHGHPRSASMASPQLQQSMSRPSSSPRPILPPPKGMQFSPSGPVQHTGSPSMPPNPYSPQQQQQHHAPMPSQHYQAQHRVPPGMSPTSEVPPRGYPSTPNQSHASGYYQQTLPYDNRRTSYSMQQQQHASPYQHQQHASPPTPQAGGYMLAPFHQDPNKPVQQQQHIRPQPPPMPVQGQHQYPQHGHHTPATAPRLQPAPPKPMLSSQFLSALATPPRPRVRPLWKESYRPSPLQTAIPPPRPEVEPLSPVLQRAKSPVRPSRSTRGNDAPTIEGPAQSWTSTKKRSKKRRSHARDRSPHSVASSTADGSSLRARTRSRSVSTVAGGVLPPDDRPASRNEVKAEPSTPANALEDDDSTTAPSTTTAPGMMTRKRRGTLQSQPLPPSKRRRQESPVTASDDLEKLHTPPRSTTIMATRNFNKMSSAIMNDITSHKHASYFAKEVRDKDAPGYSDIIREPQDLKSIRTAITAGGRAIAAASSSLESPPSGTPGASSTIIELERTVDLIPPKAIVNGAQLEKELMRMFANAYMFNPGEDAMALSTKEMFDDVEQKISDWRGTEREAGVDDDDEGKGKRRKL